MRQICPNCRNHYVPTSKRQKYCCHDCNIAYLNKRRTKEYIAHYNKKTYWSDPEYHRKRSAEYKAWVGRAVLNERNRRWYAHDSGVKRAIEARHRAKVYGHSIDAEPITKAEWQALCKVWGGCAYCKAKGVRLTQDHVIPLSKGGDHTLFNILPACRSCNTRKGDRDHIEFILEMKSRGKRK